MPIISNDYNRCEMLNLGSGPNGRGPFVIRQTGYPPGSMSLKQDPYLLRNDGVWVFNLAVFAQPEAEQKRYLYATSADVMKALEDLHGDPVVEEKLPEGASNAEILAGVEQTASRILAGLKNAKPVPLP